MTRRDLINEVFSIIEDETYFDGLSVKGTVLASERVADYFIDHASKEKLVDDQEELRAKVEDKLLETVEMGTMLPPDKVKEIIPNEAKELINLIRRAG